MSDFAVYRRWTSEQPLEARRDHCVSVRMNDAELAELDSRRGKYARGEYLRLAFFSALPPVIPELNRDAWVELSRAAANLNQLAKAYNEHGDLDTEQLSRDLSVFRSALVGARI